MDLDKPLPPESKTLTLHIHQLWVVKETWSVFSEKKDPVVPRLCPPAMEERTRRHTLKPLMCAVACLISVMYGVFSAYLFV